MPRLLLSLVGCLTAVVSGIAAAQAGDPGAPAAALSVARAIEIALSENPSLEAARSQVEIADQRLIQGRAGFMPRLSVSEGFQRTNNPPQVFTAKLNQESFTASDFAIDRLNEPNARNDFTTSFSAVWPLYDGGRSWHGWRQARLGQEAAGRAQEGTRQAVVAQVKDAYAGALLAAETLCVLESAREAAAAHRTLAADRYAAGLAVESDLLQAEVRLADLEQQRLSAESGLAVALAALKTAMGVDDALRFALTDRLQASGPPEGDLASWLAAAEAGRPDLKQMETREAMAREEIGKARAGHLPTLDLVGSYQIHTEEFDAAAESYAVGAVVSINLFAGFETSARVAEAQAALRQVQAERRRLRQQAALEVRQAHTRTASAFQRIGVAERAAGQAEASLRIVRNRYESGLATIVDLLAAEAALQQARLARSRSLHDAIVGDTHLRLAAGLLEAK